MLDICSLRYRLGRKVWSVFAAATTLATTAAAFAATTLPTDGLTATTAANWPSYDLATAAAATLPTNSLTATAATLSSALTT